MWYILFLIRNIRLFHSILYQYWKNIGFVPIFFSNSTRTDTKSSLYHINYLWDRQIQTISPLNLCSHLFLFQKYNFLSFSSRQLVSISSVWPPKRTLGDFGLVSGRSGRRGTVLFLSRASTGQEATGKVVLSHLWAYLL